MNVLHSADSKPQDTSYGHGIESFIHYLWIISQRRNGCQSRFLLLYVHLPLFPFRNQLVDLNIYCHFLPILLLKFNSNYAGYLKITAKCLKRNRLDCVSVREWYLIGKLRHCCILRESRNRPGVAQRFAGGLGSQISWHSAREGGEFVSLTHRPPLPPGMFLVLIFTRGAAT
jgi:hypothetical protein